MPTGVGAGKAKIFIYRVRDYPGLPLTFLKFGNRGEYGKVRYMSFSTFSISSCAEQMRV
jgi:hypothetical protein